MMEWLDPSLTAGVGAIVAWVGKRLFTKLVELVGSMTKLHDKLDQHIADDERRHSDTMQSMREVWRIAGEK